MWIVGGTDSTVGVQGFATVFQTELFGTTECWRDTWKGFQNDVTEIRIFSDRQAVFVLKALVVSN